MKSIISAALLSATLFTPPTALADLGAADSGSLNDSVSSKIYDAWCGKSRKGCKVKFRDGRLIVNDSNGISKDQVKRITMTIDCKVKGTPLGKGAHFCNFPSDPAYIHNSTKEFRIIYTGEDGSEKLGLISFQHLNMSRKFKQDLGFWSGEFLRPIGPSVKLEL